MPSFDDYKFICLLIYFFISASPPERNERRKLGNIVLDMCGDIFKYCHVQEMLNLAGKYNKAVQQEDELTPEKLAIANVGRQDAKKHLEEHVSDLMSSNIVQTLGTMLDTVIF